MLRLLSFLSSLRGNLRSVQLQNIRLGPVQKFTNTGNATMTHEFKDGSVSPNHGP